jgi:pantothenate kinase
MSRLVSFTITESDMEWSLFYTRETIDESLRPLAAELALQYESNASRPYCVALGGPPGSGKSAIAAVLRDMLSVPGITAIVLPLDGFHRRNEELRSTHIIQGGRSVSLLALKGASETYDIDRLQENLARLRTGEKFHWPIYSRITHETSEKGLLIDNPQALYLIEGNYLLLQRKPWVSMRSFFDKTIYIESREGLLKKRILMRKMRGGYSGRDARRHFRKSDRRNISIIMEHSGNFDYLLEHRGDYSYRYICGEASSRYSI